MRASAQIIPKISISAKRLARAKKKEREAARRKILDEYPELAGKKEAHLKPRVQRVLAHIS